MNDIPTKPLVKNLCTWLLLPFNQLVSSARISFSPLVIQPPPLLRSHWSSATTKYLKAFQPLQQDQKHSRVSWLYEQSQRSLGTTWDNFAPFENCNLQTTVANFDASVRNILRQSGDIWRKLWDNLKQQRDNCDKTLSHFKTTLTRHCIDTTLTHL